MSKRTKVPKKIIPICEECSKPIGARVNYLQKYYYKKHIRKLCSDCVEEVHSKKTASYLL
jgi:hypothetical protein